MLKFVENFLSSEKTELLFYSDNCKGQNKNRYIYSLYMYIVMSVNNITEIIHTFLTTGHTQMPVNLMHSRMENEKKTCIKM